MDNTILVLSITAASIGLGHTILGPDHYLPFIAISRARNWNLTKTLRLTFLCGIGHVMSSVVIGVIGLLLGIGAEKLGVYEGLRGGLAAWLLIIFGIIYLIWGLWKALRPKYHSHVHFLGKKVHLHKHSDTPENITEKNNITPWILFLIFILGPCEPLIPILMYPAAELSVHGVIIVSFIFAAVTIITMLLVVYIAFSGISLIKIDTLQKYSHALAGAAISLSGIGIVFLGL